MMMAMYLESLRAFTLTFRICHEEGEGGWGVGKGGRGVITIEA